MTNIVSHSYTNLTTADIRTQDDDIWYCVDFTTRPSGFVEVSTRVVNVHDGVLYEDLAAFLPFRALHVYNQSRIAPRAFRPPLC